MDPGKYGHIWADNLFRFYAQARRLYLLVLMDRCRYGISMRLGVWIGRVIVPGMVRILEQHSGMTF